MSFEWCPFCVKQYTQTPFQSCTMYMKSLFVSDEIRKYDQCTLCVWRGANLMFAHFQAQLNEMCFKMDSACGCVYAMVCILYVVSSYNQQKFFISFAWWNERRWWWRGVKEGENEWQRGVHFLYITIKTILHSIKKRMKKLMHWQWFMCFPQLSQSAHNVLVVVVVDFFCVCAVSSLSDKTTTTKLFRWIRFIYCTHTHFVGMWVRCAVLCSASDETL